MDNLRRGQVHGDNVHTYVLLFHLFLVSTMIFLEMHSNQSCCIHVCGMVQWNGCKLVLDCFLDCFIFFRIFVMIQMSFLGIIGIFSWKRDDVVKYSRLLNDLEMASVMLGEFVSTINDNEESNFLLSSLSVKLENGSCVESKGQ